MTECHDIHVHLNYDPTRTTSLRNAFAGQMSKRFNEIIRVVRTSVYTNDCFGLRSPQIFQMTPAPHQAFAFTRDPQKVAAFMEWLERQIEIGILEMTSMQQVGTGIEGAWTNRYIHDSYKRGVIRARYELDKAGFEIPSIAETGGIAITMGTPLHLDRVGVLYTRVFSELKGITSAMEQQISRILAQGIADGDNPRLLARKLVATIDGAGAGQLGITDSLGRFIPAKRRAQILARTEIIRAHHQAMIQEYKNWGIQGVFVKAEWRTAGDNRVCSRCSDLQGEIFTLEAIQNMIPLHPQCRCVALPFRQSHKTIRLTV